MCIANTQYTTLYNRHYIAVPSMQLKNSSFVINNMHFCDE